MKMASRSIDLITKKNKFAPAARFFVFICRCFARLKPQSSKLHIILMEELSYELTKYFVSCVHVRFYFFAAAHFYLAAHSFLAASISHFLTAAMKFSCFSSNEIRLLCFQSLALALPLVSP